MSVKRTTSAMEREKSCIIIVLIEMLKYTHHHYRKSIYLQQTRVVWTKLAERCPYYQYVKKSQCLGLLFVSVKRTASAMKEKIVPVETLKAHISSLVRRGLNNPQKH